MKRKLLLTFVALLMTAAAMHARAVPPDYQSQYLAIGLSPTQPAFIWFAVDSLGQGKVQQNPVLVPPIPSRCRA